jgi:hypothetical protein
MFVMAFPQECTEAFMEAHVRAFAFFGFVPTRITYDNSRIPVDHVVRDHIEGRRPLGVYLLTGDKTLAIAADFDNGCLDAPLEFASLARQYGLPVYLEASKSKGYHVWCFFETPVLAWKPRRIFQRILDEIGQPDVEVFPKHDRLDASTKYGNFINLPLFGRLVPAVRTVFLNPCNPMGPLPDQWEVLSQVEAIPEAHLDDIIEINDIVAGSRRVVQHSPEPTYAPELNSLGLPPCAQRMLAEGVVRNQRVSCFRLAAALKWTGLCKSLTAAVLREWSRRNRPEDGRRCITPEEIRHQVESAYSKPYRSRGCESAAIRPYCDPRCPIIKSRQGKEVANAH